MLWRSVAVRVLANPVSNVLQKVLARQGVPAVVVVGVTHGLLTVFCLPLFFFVSFPVVAEFWVSIAACAALAVAGNAALVQATRTADLSVLGPINAYKAVVSLVPGCRCWVNSRPRRPGPDRGR